MKTIFQSLKSFLLSFILGALSALAMAPLNFWPILFLSLGGLYILVHKSPSVTKAGLLGLLFGFGYFGFGLYWIGNALLVDGNPYRWAWPLAVMGMPLMLSPFHALACALIKKVANLQTLRGYILFSLIFGLFEWLRGHLFTGFPWNLYGYTWIDILEISQIASIYDIYLLTLFTIFWAAATGYLFVSPQSKSRKILFSLLLLSTFLGSYAFGYWRLQNAISVAHDDYNVLLIQPNIAQNEKWDPQVVAKNFTDMIQSSANSLSDINPATKATYIIWPETAISSGMLRTAWVRTAIADMLATYPHPAYLISGAQRYLEEKDQYFNSVIVFDKNAEIILAYDKSHLVPFGEYMPLSNIFDIAPIVGFKGFETGTGPTTLVLPEALSFSPLICYEVIFPEKAISPSAARPDFIINVTNDAWYGISPGPYQHLVQAQFRAIETGIPLIRVANTGFSVVVDSYGRIKNQTKIFKKETLSIKIPNAISEK